MTLKILRTGRSGRIAINVEKEVDQDSFLRIMRDSETYVRFKPETKAALHGNL